MHRRTGLAPVIPKFTLHDRNGLLPSKIIYRNIDKKSLLNEKYLTHHIDSPAVNVCRNLKMTLYLVYFKLDLLFERAIKQNDKKN